MHDSKVDAHLWGWVSLPVLFRSANLVAFRSREKACIRPHPLIFHLPRVSAPFYPALQAQAGKPVSILNLPGRLLFRYNLKSTPTKFPFPFLVTLDLLSSPTSHPIFSPPSQLSTTARKLFPLYRDRHLILLSSSFFCDSNSASQPNLFIYLIAFIRSSRLTS